jgi:membrane-associated phospholipid phosphatase
MRAAGNFIRLAVVVAGLYLLWHAYPGLNVPGTLLFLAVMMLLFTAIPFGAYARDTRFGAWRWWTAYSFGFVSFALLRSFADQDGRPVLYDYPIRFSQWLFGGQPLAERLQHLIPPTSRSDPFTLLMVGTYLSFFAVPTLVALYLGRRQPEALPRYVAATLMVWLIGLIGFYLFPTAPPWMAARDGLIGHVYRVDALIIDPGSYSQGLHLVGVNDVAAMPSIHIAQTWLAVLAISMGRRRLRAAAWLYGVAMIVAVIYLGEHWSVDVIAGLALMGMAWSLAPRMVAQRRPRRRSVPAMEPAARHT